MAQTSTNGNSLAADLEMLLLGQQLILLQSAVYAKPPSLLSIDSDNLMWLLYAAKSQQALGGTFMAESFTNSSIVELLCGSPPDIFNKADLLLWIHDTLQAIRVHYTVIKEKDPTRLIYTKKY